MSGALPEETALSARDVFERLVTPDVLDAVLRGEQPSPAFPPSHLEYVFAIVSGTTPEQISDQLGAAADLAVKHKALVVAFVCSMAVIEFPERFQPKLAPDARTVFVRDLRKQLGSQVKLVHGSSEGHYGSFGSNARLSYGFVFPQFELAVTTLSRLKFGEVEELKS